MRQTTLLPAERAPCSTSEHGRERVVLLESSFTEASGGSSSPDQG